MEESARYAVGLDVGTENVRAVVLSVGKDDTLSVIGYGEAENAGMRKGVVANLAGPAEAIDKMLGEVERMSGQEVNAAHLSINGATVMSTKVDGMIAVGAEDHEINMDDLARVEDAAVIGRIPANREILDVLPLSYTLDGQSGIKDPIHMTGARLEIKANVISALTPNVENLKRAAESANVATERLVPCAVAAGEAVLTDKQKENGVAVIDLGAATTSVAVFEEGDLQYTGVIPMGSNNITNDLAIMLEIDTELAEDIKRRFISGAFGENDKPVMIRRGRIEMAFSRAEVDDIVRARLAEIFDSVRKELKIAKYDRRLPEGMVLVGGGAKMKDIEAFAKEALEAAVRVGEPTGLTGVAEAIEKPEFATVVGLALMAANRGEISRNTKINKKLTRPGGLLKKFLKKK